MAVRRDRIFRWSDVLFPLVMLAFLLAACGLWGLLYPVPAPPTTSITLQGNLDANAPPGSVTIATIEIFDHRGVPHEMSLVFTRQNAPHTWDLAGFVSASEGKMISNQVTGVTFRPDGAFASVARQPPTMTFQINGLPQPQTVTFRLDRLTQLPEGQRPLPKPSLLTG